MLHNAWIRAAALAAVLMAGAPNASAQVKVEAEASLMAGGVFFLASPPSQFAIHRQDATPLILHEGELSRSYGLGVNAGVRIAERFGIEGMFWWVPTQLGATQGLEGYGGEVDVTSLMYGLTVAYHFPAIARFEPFVGLGAGAETMNYDGSLGWERHTDPMVNAVLGTNVRVADYAALRIEVRDCLTRFDSNLAGVKSATQNDLMVSAGLSFRSPLGR